MSTTTYLKPDSRPEVIDQLVNGVDRYNPSNVGLLEDYVYDQARDGTYDCMANLACLKLYQFNPDLYNPDIVINILVKAMTATPAPDFNLCVALLGERQPNLPLPDGELDSTPTILPLLTQLSTHLHVCRFPAFWKAYRSPEFAPLRDNYTVEIAGFDDSIREVVIRAVQAAFKTITRERLGSYLDLSGEELDKFVSSLDWKVDATSGDVAVPPNDDNQINATVVRESIQLPQLSKIIAHAQAA